MQYIGSLEAATLFISAEIFQENLPTSVLILQICIGLRASMQRSLQNPADLHRVAKIENLDISIFKRVISSKDFFQNLFKCIF